MNANVNIFKHIVKSDLDSTMNIEDSSDNQKNRQRTFDIMAWLETKNTFHGYASLDLHYTDKMGKKTVKIDHITIKGNDVILLSNRITLHITGAVQQAELVFSTNKEHKFNVLEASATPVHINAQQYLEKVS